MLEATHLVAGGSGVPLKRTPKLLAGLGHCRFVVDVEWLYQSAKEGKLLDGLEFVLCDAEVHTSKYVHEKRSDICARINVCVCVCVSQHMASSILRLFRLGLSSCFRVVLITSRVLSWNHVDTAEYCLEFALRPKGSVAGAGKL